MVICELPEKEESKIEEIVVNSEKKGLVGNKRKSGQEGGKSTKKKKVEKPKIKRAWNIDMDDF